MELDVEAPCSERRRRGAVSVKSSISCHPSGLEGGVRTVESMAVCQSLIGMILRNPQEWME